MSTNRSGGKPTERSVTNDIMFDPDAAEWMFDWLEARNLFPKYNPGFPLHGLDACCGTGILGNVIFRKRGIASMIYVDIKPPRILPISKNIFNEHGRIYDVIVCNPPWSPVEQAEEIYHHLLSLLMPGGWLYFIINYAFINTGWKRGDQLGRGIQIFLPRYTFHKSLKKIKPESTGLLDPVLMINRQREDDPPFFCSIPPEICKSEQKILF